MQAANTFRQRLQQGAPTTIAEAGECASPALKAHFQTDEVIVQDVLPSFNVDEIRFKAVHRRFYRDGKQADTIYYCTATKSRLGDAIEHIQLDAPLLITGMAKISQGKDREFMNLRLTKIQPIGGELPASNSISQKPAKASEKDAFDFM